MKTQEHTAGAERAARYILAKFGTVHEHWVSDCADIIDRSTQLPLLLKALEFVNSCQHIGNGICPECHAVAEAAIRSARGETL